MCLSVCVYRDESIFVNDRVFKLAQIQTMELTKAEPSLMRSTLLCHSSLSERQASTRAMWRG